ncbi:MAG TPA: tetratricopeptide repeat protein [Kofleriaceae bacterium]|jgi:tetratricopeptide (TPR) repeat protein
MIEANCPACGTVNRVAEADVPAGASSVTCATCKARVPLPASAKKAAAIPGIPKMPGTIPAIPKPIAPAVKPPLPKMATPPVGTRAVAPPPTPVGPPAVTLGPPGATNSPAAAAKNEIIDLSDLPAPRRASPLAGAAPTPDAKPAPRSGLSAALADLPAPKSKPAPAGPLDLDDLIPQADLPAPKAARAADPLGSKSRNDDADLPAPKARPSVGSKPPANALMDIELDLPAPKSGGASKGGALELDDLVDLPAPARGGAAPKGGALELDDLVDLPAPARGVTDLPTPARSGQVPKSTGAPRDITDLPAPKHAGGGSTDLPAPIGFFDDLPQPARKQPANAPGEIAPKGFFDDLPQPARSGQVAKSGNTPAPGPAEIELGDIAPKGFFDDLPQPTKANRPDQPSPPAPKGFFDDLPQSAGPTPRKKAPSMGIDLGADLGSDLGSEDEPIEAMDLADEAPALELDIGPEPVRQKQPSLAPANAAGGASFDDLDLSAPSSVPGARITGTAKALDEENAKAGIRFDQNKKSSPPSTPERASLPSLGKPALADDGLELAEPRSGDKLGGSQKLGAKVERKSQPQKPIRKPINKKLVGAIVLGLAVVGGGGFVMFKRHAAQQERTESINESLDGARKALASDNPNRWDVAARNAQKVLDIDPKNAAAAGIAAEAAFAGSLADGKNIATRFNRGRKIVTEALGAGSTGPELERAQALSALTSNPATSVTKLQGLLKRGADPSLSLYLGWAQERAGNTQDAIKAYDGAVNAPSTKILALLGRAHAKLAIADMEGARNDYSAVLATESDKNNIPAMVGLAAAQPAAQSQQQESDLLGIIQRKDFGGADPRAQVQAWTLAGDDARKSGRLDAARERYRNGLALDANDVGALTSAAEVELADGKLLAAQDLIDKALVQSKTDPGALLAKAKLALAQKKYDDAAAILDDLEGRKPALPTIMLVRIGTTRGKMLESREQYDAAIDAYVAASKLAGALDLAPTMAAISRLTKMAADATGDKQTALKQRADELLQELATTAEKDPSLAFTLGVAYLQTNDPSKAEPWLRRVVEARPSDPDAIYQLGKTLRLLGKTDESIELLKKAFSVAPDRIEIGVELAQTYEALKRDDDAGKLYDELLAKPGATLELHAHAGMFYLRTGHPDKAGAQGKEIIAVEKDNANGHYLIGEGALAANSLAEAKREFTLASQLERTAKSLDALARANEALSQPPKDSHTYDVAAQDAALSNYKAALELDPTIFSSQLGKGRIYVIKGAMGDGVPPLLAADNLRKGDPEVAYYLGKAYAKLGQKKVALAWMQSSARSGQKANTAYELGELYTDQEIDDARAAISAYTSAIALADAASKKGDVEPLWLPDALFKLGDLSNSHGDKGVAKSMFERYTTYPLDTGYVTKARFTEAQRHLQTDLK